MNLTLRQLRAAVAVARHLSFRRAAAEMHLSQPALSTSISELEQALGMTLFDRTSRSVKPTELGVTFIKRATRILEDMDRLMLDTSSQVQSHQGRVVISAVSSIAGRLVSRAMLLCAQKFPALEIEIRDDVATQVLQAVRSGEADFALTVEPARLEDDVVFEPCMEDPFFLVCHRDHRLAQRASVTWSELEHEHLVALAPTSGMHRIVHGELLRRHVNIAKSTPVSHLSTVHGMLETGLGVSILPSLALPVPDHPLMIAVPLEPRLSRSVGIYRRRDRSLSPAAQGLMEAIHTVIETRRERSPSGPFERLDPAGTPQIRKR